MTTPTADELITVEELIEDFGTMWLLTFRRPEDRNPLDRKTVTRLQELLSEASEKRVRAVILTGEGSAFSAGGDLKGYLGLYKDPTAFRQFQDDIYDLCLQLEAGDYVTVAMVNGACVAGGLEVALACDLIVMGESARIGDGHLKFGQLPGAGGSQRLCRAIGLQKAKEVLLTARLYTAAQAEAMGLANAVVPDDELRATSVELARSMARHSPLAVRRMKELITLSQEESRATALDAEADTVWTYATTSYDAYEGLNSFVEKRPAAYLGE